MIEKVISAVFGVIGFACAFNPDFSLQQKVVICLMVVIAMLLFICVKQHQDLVCLRIKHEHLSEKCKRLSESDRLLESLRKNSIKIPLDSATQSHNTYTDKQYEELFFEYETLKNELNAKTSIIREMVVLISASIFAEDAEKAQIFADRLLSMINNNN